MLETFNGDEPDDEVSQRLKDLGVHGVEWRNGQFLISADLYRSIIECATVFEETKNSASQAFQKVTADNQALQMTNAKLRSLCEDPQSDSSRPVLYNREKCFNLWPERPYGASLTVLPSTLWVQNLVRGYADELRDGVLDQRDFYPITDFPSKLQQRDVHPVAE